MKHKTKIMAITALKLDREEIAKYELELIKKDKLNKYEKENIEINHELQRQCKEAIKDLWSEIK